MVFCGHSLTRWSFRSSPGTLCPIWLCGFLLSPFLLPPPMHSRPQFHRPVGKTLTGCATLSNSVSILCGLDYAHGSIQAQFPVASDGWVVLAGGLPGPECKWEARQPGCSLGSIRQSGRSFGSHGGRWRSWRGPELPSGEDSPQWELGGGSVMGGGHIAFSGGVGTVKRI